MILISTQVPFSQRLEWSGIVGGDSTFAWLGDIGSIISDRAVLEDVQVTPTRTMLTLIANDINVTVTFLSPIEVRISLYH